MAFDELELNLRQLGECVLDLDEDVPVGLHGFKCSRISVNPEGCIEVGGRLGAINAFQSLKKAFTVRCNSAYPWVMHKGELCDSTQE